MVSRIWEILNENRFIAALALPHSGNDQLQ